MTSRPSVVSHALGGAVVLERQPVRDERGFLERVFCTEALRDVLGDRGIVQINRTLTRLAGTVRGIHYQMPPEAEMKIVSCLKGAVFDVAVDLRRGSPTFLQWHGEVLSADNGRSLVIPEGFGHGFQTLEPDCEMLYLHTAAYAPAAERGVDPLDPALAIRWPQPVAALSERDRSHPPLTDTFEGVAS